MSLPFFKLQWVGSLGAGVGVGVEERERGGREILITEDLEGLATFQRLKEVF